MTALDDDVRTLFAGKNTGHVATVMPDGAPHSVPVWVDLEGDRIAFLTGPDSRKAQNLARDPRVAISVTEQANPFILAYVRGHVAERVEGDEAWRIIDRISTKYVGGPYPRGEDRVVFLVEADRAVAQSFG
jgi:PPOX class probable F420-dependent enzyme